MRQRLAFCLRRNMLIAYRNVLYARAAGRPAGILLLQ